MYFTLLNFRKYGIHMRQANADLVKRLRYAYSNSSVKGFKLYEGKINPTFGMLHCEINPRNLFWKLIYAVFGEPEVPADYEERIRFLLQKGIALWDVYAQCERTGSLDSNIKNGITNDFWGFFAAHPNIRCLAFNGSLAYKAFSGAVRWPAHCSILRLPSSSPAHTTMSFHEKLSEWKQIADYCD